VAKFVHISIASTFLPGLEAVLKFHGEPTVPRSSNMFICRACWRRALNSTPVTYPTTARLHLAQQATKALRSSDKRQLATATVSTPKATLPKEDEGNSNSTNSRDKAIRWKVKKHLEYLDNNYKIAEHVERTLERGDFDEALLLVREASRKGDVTVSWNHLIGYLMRNQRLHAAVKLYNEVRLPPSLHPVEAISNLRHRR
jgi:pentatricopeptide repeat protein